MNRKPSRRELLLGAAAAAFATGCPVSREGGSRVARPDLDRAPHAKEIALAVARGRRFLATKQGEDGAWRSDVYGAFKDGFSLTPLVSLAIGKGAEQDRGAAWLAGRVKADGTIDPGKHGLSYPAYSSSGTVLLLSGTPAHTAARDAWLRYLLDRQLGESLGWAPSDVHYGGWGYYPRIPRKPPAGEGADALIESNLSATAFALEAVRAAGVTDPAVYARARVLVESCQNYGWPGADGGFFFVHDDEARNKAGMVVEGGARRFHSYGSMTADGLRCLTICGAPLDDPRVVAARSWLEKNFSGSSHPGTYREDREISRESLYYYWAVAVAKAFSETKTGPAGWRDALATALLKRQRPDGSWQNASIAVREDDPLVATAFAIEALTRLLLER